MTPIQVTLKLSRETKGTFRFDAPGEVPGQGEPVLSSVYIRKGAFDGRPPESITVTVSPSI